MDETKPTSRPLNLGPMARRVRVPAKWLRAEAEAGRIPHLRAGSAFLFDPGVVERLLLERVRGATPKGVQHG